MRGPGTFQGAQGMKPVAREARPPRRSPGLRWALPLLLLLCRLGQVSGRGPGRGGTGIPGTCPRRPPAGRGRRARARVLIAPLLEGSREGAGSALHAGERAPSPAARYRRAGRGLQGPGVPSASGWKPRGLQAISGPFFPEPFQSGRPSSPAGGGRRGCVCPGCRARSGADPACRARGAGPKGCGGGGRAGQGGGRGAGSPGPGVPFL